MFQLEFSFSLQWALREKLRWRTQNSCGTACFWSSESSENWKNEEFKITVEEGIACFRRPYDFFYCFLLFWITLLALLRNTYILLFFIFNLHVLIRYIYFLDIFMVVKANFSLDTKVKKRSVFVHAQGIKTVNAGGGGGQNMAKFCP